MIPASFKGFLSAKNSAQKKGAKAFTYNGKTYVKHQASTGLMTWKKASKGTSKKKKGSKKRFPSKNHSAARIPLGSSRSPQFRGLCDDRAHFDCWKSENQLLITKLTERNGSTPSDPTLYNWYSHNMRPFRETDISHLLDKIDSVQPPRWIKR